MATATQDAGTEALGWARLRREGWLPLAPPVIFGVMEMDMAGAAGTWVAHWLPGLAFVIWGLWWLGHTVRARGIRPPGSQLEDGYVAPAIKILVLFVAGYIEMPNRGWFPADYVMGLHHITIYIGFALSGVVDILARRGILAPRVTHLALAGAALNGWLMFLGHGNHPGVEGSAHAMLAWTFFGVALAAVAEVAREDWRLDWLRIGGILALGMWFMAIAWMLFRSGWDLSDPVRVGWVYVIYGWTVCSASVIVLGARVLVSLMPTPSQA